jgi:TonB-dependent starch-binding outer membrane protein SusC
MLMLSIPGYSVDVGTDSDVTYEVAMQQITVTGTITDAQTGEGLPGVNIMIRGTSLGTVTNIDGNYRLEVPGPQAVLVFSFVGYAQQIRAVGDQRTINIQLAPDLTALDEVQVVGYGSVRRSVLTGAISRIQMETIQPIATQRVDQMLQGRAAGVLVLNTDGSPGGNTTIRIRGMNSIQGGNSALIVIDGFQGGDLMSVNPNDIASVEILKDASATAIYGAQGANGVILIETKKGKTEKPVINYSSEVGFSNILMGGIELMDAATWARDMNFYEMMNDRDVTPIPIFSPAEIAEFERTGGTDWMKEVYGTGVTQSHQLSVSGRADLFNYFVSGSLYDQGGIMLNSGYKRYSLRANINADVTSWARFNLNWDGSQQDRFGPQFGGALDWPGNPVLGAMQFAPVLPVFGEDGKYSKPSNLYGEPILWNPVASAQEVLNENRRTTNNVNIYMDFTLLEGLTLRLGGGGRFQDYGVQRFFNNETFSGNQNNGIGYASNSNSRNYQTSNVLSYNRDFGLHHVNAILVGELKYDESYWFEANNSNFSVHQTSVYNLGGATIQRTASSFSERKIVSGLTRVNYGYDNRYIFAFSFRADGSSVFGANHKWGHFPSVSAGWRISQEAFMIDHQDLISNLMIRASWGRTGNQAINTYQTLARIGGAGRYPWDGGGNVNLGYQISSASNPNLKWETTTQTNIGVDLSMFRGRLRATVEYYDKVTEDLLMARELPRTTGLSSIIDNVGSMGNKGWEFSVDGDINAGSLRWTTGASLTFSKTTVLDLGTSKFLAYSAGGSGHSANIPFMFLKPGERFGQIMGFGYEGTWNLGEEAQAARYGQMPGDPRYTDVNDDGRIDYDNDFMVIGNALPDFIFGINNQLNYKNWDVTFLIQGTYGNDLFNIARSRREERAGRSTNKLNRWTPDNQNTDVPAVLSAQYRYEYREAYNAANPDNPLVSTIIFPAAGSNVTGRWIEDASYLRLKNVTIAYNIPTRYLVNNLRVYASGTNLLTFTKYSGFDPEVSSFTGSDGQLGTDYNNYPPSRFINLGVNVTF